MRTLLFLAFMAGFATLGYVFAPRLIEDNYRPTEESGQAAPVARDGAVADEALGATHHPLAGRLVELGARVRVALHVHIHFGQLEPVEQEAETFRPTLSLFYWPLGAAITLSFLVALMRLPWHLLRTQVEQDAPIAGEGARP